MNHGTVADAFGKVLKRTAGCLRCTDEMWNRQVPLVPCSATPYMREDKLYLIGVVSDVSNLYDLILKEKEKNMKDTFTECYNKNGFKELCKKISGQKPQTILHFYHDRSG